MLDQPIRLLCDLAEGCSVAGDIFGPIMFEPWDAERDLADALRYGEATGALADVALTEGDGGGFALAEQIHVVKDRMCM